MIAFAQFSHSTLAFNTIHWRDPAPPVAVALASWLDSWRGVGAIVGGMRRLGYDVELKQFPMTWRVNFRRRGDEHVVGSAWEETAWRAVQLQGEGRPRETLCTTIVWVLIAGALALTPPVTSSTNAVNQARVCPLSGS